MVPRVFDMVRGAPVTEYYVTLRPTLQTEFIFLSSLSRKVDTRVLEARSVRRRRLRTKERLASVGPFPKRRRNALVGCVRAQKAEHFGCLTTRNGGSFWKECRAYSIG